MNFATFSRNNLLNTAATIQFSDENREDGFMEISVTNGEVEVRFPDFDLEVAKSIFGPIMGHIPRENYSQELVEIRKDSVLRSPEPFEGGLSVKELSLSDWHEQSNDGLHPLRALEVSKQASLVTILFQDGTPMISSRQASDCAATQLHWAEEAAIEEATEWMFNVPGDTVLHALFCPTHECLFVLDIQCLGGVWLTSLPRIKRLEHIAVLFNNVDSERISPIHDLAPIPSGTGLDARWGGGDDQMAKEAFIANNRLLCFSLTQDSDFDFAWINPSEPLYCRVLTRSTVKEGPLPTYEYGLGLLCPKDDQEVLVANVQDVAKFDVDDLVRVDAYVSLALEPGEMKAFTSTPRIISQAAFHDDEASCLYV